MCRRRRLSQWTCNAISRRADAVLPHICVYARHASREWPKVRQRGTVMIRNVVNVTTSRSLAAPACPWCRTSAHRLPFSNCSCRPHRTAYAGMQWCRNTTCVSKCQTTRTVDRMAAHLLWQGRVSTPCWAVSQGAPQSAHAQQWHPWMALHTHNQLGSTYLPFCDMSLHCYCLIG